MDIFNESIAFGMTPFETIYFSDRIPKKLEYHYKRLCRASKIFNSPYNESFDEFKDKINSFLESSSDESGVLKVILLNGCLEFKVRQSGYSKEGFIKGASLCVSKLKRDPNSIYTYFKTLNYGINVLEDKRAKLKGYDGCLFLNYKDEICETSYANIFFKKDKVIYTPSLRCGILPGVMRNDIIKFSRKNGYSIEKTKLYLEDLKLMDEAFISNSVLPVYSVKSIGDIKFSSREFVDFIASNNEFRRPWNMWSL